VKLSTYAKKLGVCYRTAWDWWKKGKLNAYQLDTGTIIVVDEPSPHVQLKVAIYARVSTPEKKSQLETQAQRLLDYCAAKGYKVEFVVKEVASGLNDQRPKLTKLLVDQSINLIVVEHKDRLTRFGFNYLELLLGNQHRTIEVINNDVTPRDDLMGDFVAIITSFCARLYGQRRCKRKTERIIAELTQDEKER
jgi:predicted site-specific integrase-resolvase